MRWLCALVLFTACGEHERTQEEILREDYVRGLVDREGVSSAYKMQSSYDVRFDSGFSEVGFDPPGDCHNKAFRWIGQRAFARLRPHGAKPMKLTVFGWTDTKAIQTRPEVTAYIDGKAIADMVVDEGGGFGLVGIAGPDLLAGKRWVTLELYVSSVSFHWDEPPKLMVANIQDFDWSEAPLDTH